MAFYHLEPFGCHVEDQRTEYLLSLIWQANSKKGTKVPRFIERDKRPAPVKSKALAAKELDAKINATLSRFVIEEATPEPAPAPTSDK